ncbi:hypothetical protein [Spiroplasma endosymbiont of 'Nebria riversi']|uniref:hypothetical protein n=1 Tax=Spiroplasma endosymbiont of 'Nebria riversi' TaxID=2792084 RepID=UPI001C05CA3E|nr:hypothetical protein [Spiroplasma endosymbiont of 'Nebria riversi']
MRIIPYELICYANNMSLSALRKEISMYDYCLNKNKNNIAMNPFLKLKRPYFNLVIYTWITEMNKRNLYVGTLVQYYAKNNPPSLIIDTNIFLIIECCLQWDLKQFNCYEENLSWFAVINKFLTKQDISLTKWNLTTYNEIKQWYEKKFMRKNNRGKMKPYKLNMTIVINFLETALTE